MSLNVGAGSDPHIHASGTPPPEAKPAKADSKPGHLGDSAVKVLTSKSPHTPDEETAGKISKSLTGSSPIGNALTKDAPSLQAAVQARLDQNTPVLPDHLIQPNQPGQNNGIPDTGHLFQNAVAANPQAQVAEPPQGAQANQGQEVDSGRGYVGTGGFIAADSAATVVANLSSDFDDAALFDNLNSLLGFDALGPEVSLSSHIEQNPNIHNQHVVDEVNVRALNLGDAVKPKADRIGDDKDLHHIEFHNSAGALVQAKFSPLNGAIFIHDEHIADKNTMADVVRHARKHHGNLGLSQPFTSVVVIGLGQKSWAQFNTDLAIIRPDLYQPKTEKTAEKNTKRESGIQSEALPRNPQAHIQKSSRAEPRDKNVPADRGGDRSRKREVESMIMQNAEATAERRNEDEKARKIKKDKEERYRAKDDANFDIKREERTKESRKSG